MELLLEEVEKLLELEMLEDLELEMQGQMHNFGLAGNKKKIHNNQRKSTIIKENPQIRKNV